MEAGAPDGAAQPSPAPAEADWPPELRVPPPPPPADPPPSPGTDDPHFLSSIIGDAAPPPPPPPPPSPSLGQKRKRGRPPKRKDGAAAASGAGAVVPAPARAARRREDEEEVVCFICFDGGNLVVCDRRGCPKVYHPACIKRDEAFFQSRSKWNCGWGFPEQAVKSRVKRYELSTGLLCR